MTSECSTRQAANAADIEQQFHGGLARGVSFAASLMLTASSSALLYRYLGVGATGSYLTVIALVALLRGISEGGITSLAIRELAVTQQPDRGSLARTLIGTRLTLTCAVLAPLVVATALAETSRAIALGTLYVALGAALQSYQEAISSELIVDGALKTVALIDLSRAVASAITITAGVVFHAGLETFFLAPLAAALLSLACSIAVLRSDGHYVPLLRSKRVRELAADLMPLSLATLGQIAYFRLGVILVAACSNPTETGYFAAAFRIVEVLVVLPGIVLSGLLPALARGVAGDPAAFRRTLRSAFARASLLGAMTAVGLYAGAPVAIAVIAGPDFHASVNVLRFMAFGIAASFPAYVIGMAFATLRLYRELMITNISVLVIAIAAYVTLAQAFGARGGGAATATGEAALLVIGFMTLRRQRPELAVDVAPLVLAFVAVAVVDGLVATTTPPALPAAILAPTIVLAAGASLAIKAR